jgi:hypothetical protein
MMVERAVTGKADRVAQKPPKRVSLLKRIHIPWRSGTGDLRRIHCDHLEAIAGMLEETSGRKLGEDCWKNPARRMSCGTQTDARNCGEPTKIGIEFAFVGHFFLFFPRPSYSY